MIETHDACINSLIKSKSIDQLEISCQIDWKIRKLVKNVKLFGSVKLKTVPVNMVKKKMQDQNLTSTSFKSIENIKVTLVKKVKTHSWYVGGCCATSNGDFLFTNHIDKSLRAVHSDNSYTEIKCPSCNAFDVICIDDETCAVTLGYSQMHGINLINLTKLKVTHVVKLPDRPYGITYDGDSMICCVKDNDLHVISCLADYKTSTISNTILPGFSYVSAFGEYIYYTNGNENTVTCGRPDGNIAWRYKDNRFLSSPRGITLDNNGNIFVVGVKSNNVVVISPSGIYLKEILT